MGFSAFALGSTLIDNGAYGFEPVFALVSVVYMFDRIFDTLRDRDLTLHLDQVGINVPIPVPLPFFFIWLWEIYHFQFQR